MCGGAATLNHQEQIRPIGRLRDFQNPTYFRPVLDAAIAPSFRIQMPKPPRTVNCLNFSTKAVPAMQDLPPQLVLDGAVATIQLHRPSVANRLEVADIEALSEHIIKVNASPEVRVLRLRSTGKHFCAGFNITSVPGLDAGALFEALADLLECARPVTIAEVSGGIYGGATDLALACDFRLGLGRSEMFVPAARLGLHFYRGGLERFVSRLGLNMAKRVLLAGEVLNAEQMLACGFLDHVYEDPAALMAAAAALSQQLQDMAPQALLGMKQHLNAIARNALDVPALHADIARSLASQDLSEGVQAWSDKRKPVFRGD